MAPMGLRLSPLGVAVFCLLGFGVIYHLYAGVIYSRLAAFRSDSHPLTLTVTVAVKRSLSHWVNVLFYIILSIS